MDFTTWPRDIHTRTGVQSEEAYSPVFSSQRFKLLVSSLRSGRAQGGYLPPRRHDPDLVPAILSPPRVFVKGPQDETLEVLPDDPRYQVLLRMHSDQLSRPHRLQPKRKGRGRTRSLFRRSR